MFKNLPIVTRNLLVINCVVYLLQLALEQRGTDLTASLGLHFVLADHFNPVQFVTYMFLHGSFTHLFFNMFSLWMFGRIVEQAMGTQRFIVFWLVCGIGAGLCQEVWQTGQYLAEGLYQYDGVTTGYSVIPMGAALDSWTTIGASGACYGVLLAFGMAYPNERIMLLIPPIPIKAKYFVVGYAAIEVVSAFTSSGNIAHFAHLGGMLFGWLAIVWWRRKARRGSSGRYGYRTTTPSGRPVTARIRAWWQRLTAPKMKVTPGGKPQTFKDRQPDYDYNSRRSREDQERIDAILLKIKQSGYQSLTDDEKRFLFTQSRK